MVGTKELKYIRLEYSGKDLEYIDELAGQIDLRSEEIVAFFGFENFGRKVGVRLSDSLKAFRETVKLFGMQTDKRGRIPPWVCGIAHDGEIVTLCLKEFRKTKGHRKETVEGLIRLVLHEFVHACHRKAAGEIACCVWLSEGMATALSRQNGGREVRLAASLEEMKAGYGNYDSCCAMFEYVRRKYGRAYILELIRDNEKANNETPRLYAEAFAATNGVAEGG